VASKIKLISDNSLDKVNQIIDAHEKDYIFMKKAFATFNYY